MVTSDPIADMLARINNGYLASKSDVILPWSKLKEQLAKVMLDSNYLDNVEESTRNGHRVLVLSLKYLQKKPAISTVKRISRPSLRVYVKANKIPRVLGGIGTAVISTPIGLLTDKQARQKNLGGEVVCEIS